MTTHRDREWWEDVLDGLRVFRNDLDGDSELGLIEETEATISLVERIIARRFPEARTVRDDAGGWPAEED